MTGSQTIRQAARELAMEIRLFENAKIGDPVVHCRRYPGGITKTHTYIRAIAGEVFTVADSGGMYTIADGRIDTGNDSVWVEKPRPTIPPEAAAVIDAIRDVLKYPQIEQFRRHAQDALDVYDAANGG